MHRYFLLFLLTSTIIFCFAHTEQASHASMLAKYREADKNFHEAERLSHLPGASDAVQVRSDTIYLRALSQFASLIRESAGYDSLHFFIRLRTGYIEFLFDSLKAAQKDFAAAIRLKEKLPMVADSFLFVPLLYTGSIFYSQNAYDSSIAYYKKAEAVGDKYAKPLNESQRLFNRLGVMYYETGNYRDARNYFEKAIAVASPSATNLLANYRINIASMYVKLGELDKAKDIYEALLPLHVFSNEIEHNLGIIALRQKDFKTAIAHFDNVNYSDDKKTIELYYNKAMAWSGLSEPDSAQQFVLKALAENLKWNGHKKNIAFGLILKFEGDEAARYGLYKESLNFYQQAIMQFDPEFSESDVNKNPEEFGAVYSYINLFNTLAAKADALQLQYRKDKNVMTLQSSLETYKAAFALAGWVEKTYNSDEARLVLGRVKYSVHSRPIDIGLELYQLTRKREWLEQVYFFDQENKASMLALRLREQEIRSPGTDKNELYSKQATLQTAITRASLKIGSVGDSAQLSALHSSIRDNEIELNKIQDQIKSDPSRQLLLGEEQVPGVSQVQRRLDGKTALLSYHLSEKELLILVITANHFEYYRDSINSDFFAQVTKLKTALYDAGPGQRYTGTGPAMYLYRQLIAPVSANLSQIERLIIIPDDELHYLPFETLQDENNNYLLQRFSIQYQYATALLGDKKTFRSSSPILSFAPFVSSGFHDSSGLVLGKLPASGSEVSDPTGKAFIDSAATRRNFLELANHYGIVHLATHASADNNDPMRSFIAFYPADTSYKLYASEIYDLRLDSTDLVILSACETGSGQLVRGEGLMSLSRAFAYAGCPNIITSLWKAEDKTTAFITQRLYYYLRKRYNKDEALQLAKLDMINKPDIAAYFKAPPYWAHLILIGNYEPDHKRNNWSWVAIGIIGILLGYYYIKKKSLPGRKGRQA